MHSDDENIEEWLELDRKNREFAKRWEDVFSVCFYIGIPAAVYLLFF